MDFTEKRAQAVSRLGELQKVKPKVYTALELHPKRQMLSRVQRKEQQQFQQRVQKRKIKLKKDISDIDKYLQSVEARNDFLASLPPNGKFPTMPVLPIQAPAILPSPTIVFGPRPMMRETRLKRYKRGGRY